MHPSPKTHTTITPTRKIETATQTDPDSLSAWTKLEALATALRDDVENAEQIQVTALDNIIRLDPDNVLAWAFLSQR